MKAPVKDIDARGLACPGPVLEIDTLLKHSQPEKLRVRLDHPAACQTVQQFLESRGFDTCLQTDGADHLVVARRAAAPASQPRNPMAAAEAHERILVLCATDRIGVGDDALGIKLMVNFIRTLKEMGSALWRLVLVNNGVKLSVEGSTVLADLQAREAQGLKILVCGTCLDHFDLLDKKQAGETTNMLDIVTAMQVADKVITI